MVVRAEHLPDLQPPRVPDARRSSSTTEDPGRSCRSGGCHTIPRVDASPPDQSALCARSVLVVEDDSLLRQLVVAALEGKGFAAVAAGSAIEAKRMFRAMDPDGIVMDIDLGPGANGFDLAEMLLEEGTGVAIVFLTNLPDARFAGLDGTRLPPGVAYLRKEAVSDVEMLASTLDATLRGAVEARMRHDCDPQRPLARLTAGQVQILRLIALGKTNKQISDIRGTTVIAVEHAVSRAFAAIGVDDAMDANRRVEAARRFISLAGAPLPFAEERGP